MKVMEMPRGHQLDWLVGILRHPGDPQMLGVGNLAGESALVGFYRLSFLCLLVGIGVDTLLLISLVFLGGGFEWLGLVIEEDFEKRKNSTVGVFLNQSSPPGHLLGEIDFCVWGSTSQTLTREQESAGNLPKCRSLFGRSGLGPLRTLVCMCGVAKDRRGKNGRGGWPALWRANSFARL